MTSPMINDDVRLTLDDERPPFINRNSSMGFKFSGLWGGGGGVRGIEMGTVYSLYKNFRKETLYEIIVYFFLFSLFLNFFLAKKNCLIRDFSHTCIIFLIFLPLKLEEEKTDIIYRTQTQTLQYSYKH